HGRPAADGTGRGRVSRRRQDHPGGRRGAIFDGQLVLFPPAPGGDDKADLGVEELDQGLQRVEPNRVLLAEVSGAGEQRLLDLLEHGREGAPRPARGTAFFSRSGRRAPVPSPFARSRGPTSIRKGTPFSSHSLNLKPGRSSRQSTLTPMAARAVSTCWSAVSIWLRSASLRKIGTMITCAGAIRGGSCRPESSPGAITPAPPIR